MVSQRWVTLPRRRPLVALGIAIAVSEVVGGSGGVFTASGISSWYPTLQKPGLTPPGPVFAPVWTALFALMGVAAWIVWRALPGANAGAARVALVAFAVQFVINVSWSAVFFGARSIAGGLVVIALLWLAIVATMGAFARVDRRAAALLVPYLAWVSFAAFLNYRLWVLN